MLLKIVILSILITSWCFIFALIEKKEPYTNNDRAIKDNTKTKDDYMTPTSSPSEVE